MSCASLLSSWGRTIAFWVSVFVLLPTLSSGQFLEYTEIAASDGHTGNFFGSAVGVVNTTVVVGAYGDSSSTGAVYFFAPDNVTGQFTEISKLIHPEVDSDGGPATGDEFGRVIKFVDNRLFVTALARQVHGAVYIWDYDVDTQATSFLQKLSPTSDVNTPDPAVRFGKSLDVTDDLSELIIGSPVDSSLLDRAGAAYIYQFDTNTQLYVLDEKVRDEVNGEVNGQFGECVAVDVDVALVGAHLAENDASVVNAGRFYILQEIDGLYLELGEDAPFVAAEIVQDPDAIADDRFGDVCQMRDTRALIGTSFSPGTADLGTVHVLERGAAGLTTLEQITPNTLVTGDRFGYALDMQGNRFLASAPFTTVDGVDDAGTVYLYEDVFGNGQYELYFTFVPQNPRTDGNVGLSVAMDVVSDVYVLGGHADGSTSDPGAAYVWSVDVGTEAPSSRPSIAPSAAPTPAFDICGEIYICDCRPFQFWPFCRGPKTYMHRFTGPNRGSDGAPMSCQTQCVDNDKALRRLESESEWICGTCLF